MDKKDIKKTSSVKKPKVYDDKEDLEIRSVAYFKGSSQLLLLMVLIILFGFTFFNSLYYIGKYYQNKDAQNKGVETVEINNNKYQVLITNDSTINGTLKDSNIKEEEDLVITKVNTIIMNTNDQNENDIELTFDIRYNILENDFPVRTHASNSSDLLTRFAYSYDNKNWTYINNAISTVNSTMTPGV